MYGGRVVINFDSGFVGSDLEYVEGGLHIEVCDGVIEHIGRGRASGSNVIDLGPVAIMPPLANLHVHILDYILPEVGWDLDLDSMVGEPYSVKYLIIGRASEQELSNVINKFIELSWRYGVGVVAEFREGGSSGAKLDIKSRPKTHFVLGMPKLINGDVVNEVWSMRDYVNGIAVSSPLYFPEEVLKELGKIARSLNLQIHAHVSETPETHEGGDLSYLLSCIRPTAIVHGTYLTEEELMLLSDLGIPLILCPRSNYWFLGSVPNLKTIYELNLSVGLGTDNACWVKGDLWRDLEFLANTLRSRGVLDPKWLLKISTVSSEIIGLRNSICEGCSANMLILNEELVPIRTSKDKYLAVIKRGGPEAVEGLIVDGVPRYCSSRYEAVCNNIRNSIC